jgi:hypothetical protein
MSIVKYNIETIKAAGLFPEQAQENAQNLIAFIEKYYEYLNDIGLPSYEIENITREKDIDRVSYEYLDQIQNLIAKNVPNSVALDKVTLYKIIFKYYHSRGSEDSIYSFFKIFFNEAVRVFYPKDFLFDLSAGIGEWAKFNPLTLETVTTNPNKKYMRVRSGAAIAPDDPNREGYSPNAPLLHHLREHLWTFDGLQLNDPDAPNESYNIPHIVRTNIAPVGSPAVYRWRFKYQDLISISSNYTKWPDEAIWPYLVREIGYIQPDTPTQDVDYLGAPNTTSSSEFYVYLVGGKQSPVNPYSTGGEYSGVINQGKPVLLQTVSGWPITASWNDLNIPFGIDKSIEVIVTEKKIPSSFTLLPVTGGTNPNTQPLKNLNLGIVAYATNTSNIVTIPYPGIYDVSPTTNWNVKSDVITIQDQSVNKEIDYYNDISVEAEPLFGSDINQLVNSLEDAPNSFVIYRLKSLRPKEIWEATTVTDQQWRYIQPKSLLSDRFKLHDSNYWQTYSYEIITGLSSSEWKNAYSKFVHPSGLKLFVSLILEAFNTNNGWSNYIPYNDAENDYSWISQQRRPSLGSHIPKFQPGWIDVGDRLLTFILSALRQKFIIIRANEILVEPNPDPNYGGGYKVYVSAPKHDFNVGDRINITNVDNDAIAGYHRIVEAETNSFAFIINEYTTSIISGGNVVIYSNNSSAPDGYSSYENLICVILLDLFTKNTNTRDQIVHREYQDWIKFLDSTQLGSGWSDKTIAESLKSYDRDNQIKFNNVSCYVDILNTKQTSPPSVFSRFYPWNYSNILNFDDSGYYTGLEDYYDLSYEYNVFEDLLDANYDYSYTPEYVPYEISFTSPIITEDQDTIVYQEDQDYILLENAKFSDPTIDINTFEFVLENSNRYRIYENGDSKALTK